MACRPMHGKDLHNLHNLHMGDMTCGILPAAAPLAIGSLTLAGGALAEDPLMLPEVTAKTKADRTAPHDILSR